jgi:hypothetical protein
MAALAVKNEKLVKKAVETLCEESDELLQSVEVSKINITTLKNSVAKLQKQVQQESEANGENNNDTSANPLQLELMELQMNMENAQADSTVSSKRIAVAKTTFKLFALVSSAEKAYKASEEAFSSKSQARLHSQVFCYTIHNLIQ